MTSRWALLAVLAAFGVAAQSDPRVPPLTAHVTDLTGTLDPQQIQTLEDELKALEQSKGSQVAVLIVATTEPEDIAAFGIRVAEAWKLGRAGTDDGVILIVAKNDRRVRIEVGRGLEGAIPDAAAARVIREYLTPRFRAEDYYGGIHDATDALTKLINDEPLPPPLTDERDNGLDGANRFMPSLVAAWFVAVFLRGLFGRAPTAPRAGIVGLGSGVASWLVSGWLPLGIGVGILGLIFGLLGGGGGSFAKRGGWGGFGGGGFGGGGGFAGGGASGRW